MEKYAETLKSSHPWSFFTNLVVENTNEIVLDDTHAKRFYYKFNDLMGIKHQEKYYREMFC